MNLTKKDRGYISLIVAYFLSIAVFQFAFWGWSFIERIGGAFLVSTGIALGTGILFGILCWADKE